MVVAYSVTPFCHSVLLSFRDHSLSDHYLNNNRCTHSTQVWYIDVHVSWLYRQGLNSVLVGWFFTELCLLKKLEIHFQIIISKMVANIQLKFDILMNLINIQVEVYICYGPLICQMCPLSFEGMHTLIYKSEISYVGYFQKNTDLFFIKFWSDVFWQSYASWT